jgi:vacuolar-type H+-ATPase subunit I/STV1
MIVAVKRNKSQKILKIIIVVLLVSGGAYYYNDYIETARINAEKQKLEEEQKRVLKAKEEEQEKIKQEAQREILAEVEKAVNLIGQEHVRDVKLIKNKVVFVCEPDTNIDALVVRYGAMALIKKTFDEIVIVVDIDFILKNKL